MIGGVLIAAAIITLYTPGVRLFDLREIVVKGTHRLTSEEIVQAAGFRVGTSLLRTPIRRATEAISQLPWVKEVSIRRVWPHKAEIMVEERAPIAVIPHPEDKKSRLVVGEGGVIVQRTGESAFPQFSIRGAHLTGADPGARLTDKWVIPVLEALHQRELNKAPFTLVDFSNPQAVMLYGENGLEVLLGPIDGVKARLDALATLLATLDPTDYRSIDLRFGGEATLAPRKVVK